MVNPQRCTKTAGKGKTEAILTKAILIGAGFSCDLGMPSAAELSKIFFKIFNYESIKNHLIPNIENSKPYGNDTTLSKDAFLDIIKIFKNNTETNYENLIKQIIPIL